MLILERPIITEKTMAQAQNGVYTFAVNVKAPKPEIAKAVAKAYGVTVSKVRVESVKGRRIRRRTGTGKERDWKKALVTLTSGQAIKDFALPEEKPEAKSKKDKE